MERGRVTLLWVGVATLAFILVSCGDNNQLFSSLDESEDPVLTTLPSGSVVRPGETISVNIEYPDADSSRATSMRVDVLDMDGAVVGSLEFDGDDLAEPQLPPIRLPGLSVGPYRLHVEAWIHDELLFSDDRRFFVLDTTPHVESLAVYPSSLGPDSQAIAIAEVTLPDGTRPYLRWIFDERPITSGYLEDGGDRALIEDADLAAGAYRVVLEVYPWGPEEGVVADGATDIVATGDVFIRESFLSQHIGGDEGETHLLYSFDGTLRGVWFESGREPLIAQTTGSARLDVIDGAIGYRLDDDGRLAVELPLEAAGRVEMRLLVFDKEHDEDVAEEGVAGEVYPLILGRVPDGIDPLFEVRRDVSDGITFASRGDHFSVFPPEEGAPSRAIDITFLFERDETSTTVSVVGDDEIVGAVTIPSDQWADGEPLILEYSAAGGAVLVDTVAVKADDLETVRRRARQRSEEQFLAIVGDGVEQWIVNDPDVSDPDPTLPIPIGEERRVVLLLPPASTAVLESVGLSLAATIDELVLSEADGRVVARYSVPAAARVGDAALFTVAVVVSDGDAELSYVETAEEYRLTFALGPEILGDQTLDMRLANDGGVSAAFAGILSR